MNGDRAGQLKGIELWGVHMKSGNGRIHGIVFIDYKLSRFEMEINHFRQQTSHVD